MSKLSNYIVVHADGDRYLAINSSGAPYWVRNLAKARSWTQSGAVHVICRYNLSAGEQRIDKVEANLAKVRATKAQAQTPEQPPVILRRQEHGKMSYLYRFSSNLGGIASFTSTAKNARKFKSFQEAEQFIAKAGTYDHRVRLCTPVHLNVAHVAEGVLANRPAQDSRIQQVVEQFNSTSSIHTVVSSRDVVRVWTFLNPSSKSGLSMVVSVDSGLSKLEAWANVRSRYGIKSSLPAAYDEYRGTEAQNALKLAMDMTVVKF